MHEEFLNIIIHWIENIVINMLKNIDNLHKTLITDNRYINSKIKKSGKDVHACPHKMINNYLLKLF